MPPVSPKTIFLPVKSMNDSCRGRLLFLDAPQFVQHKQHSADTDGAVGGIECRPVPAADMHVEEIDDVAIHDTVKHVTEGAAHNQRQCPAKHALRSMTLQQ